MTVGATIFPLSYIGNGVTTLFPTNFDWALRTDVKVNFADATGAAANIAYAIIGVSGASSVQTVAPLPVGYVITITRKTTRVQGAKFPPGEDFPASVFEAALDRAALVDQEQDADIASLNAHAFKVLAGDPAPSPIHLANFAGKYFVGDASGQPVPSAGTGADGALRADLASLIGALLVMLSSGASLQSYIDALEARTKPVSEAGTKGRLVPNAAFNWFTTLGWFVTKANGVGNARLNRGVKESFEANFSAFIGGASIWISPNGNDATGTGSRSAPYQTLGKARTTAAYNIFMEDGDYAPADHRYTDTFGDKPKRYIARGRKVRITPPGPALSSLTFVAEGTITGLYVLNAALPVGQTPVRVLAADVLDEYGDADPLNMPALEGATLAAAKTALGNCLRGWWYDSATRLLYVRRGVTDLSVAGNRDKLRIVWGDANRDNVILLYATNSYWEGMEIEGYFNLLEQAGQPTPQVWLKNVKGKYGRSDFVGGVGGYYYAEGCEFRRGTADGFKLNDGIVAAHGLEYKCTARAMGDAATFDDVASYGQYYVATQQAFNPIAPGSLNKNASSSHTGDVIRINCDYADSAGPDIADTAGSISWNIGVRTGSSGAYAASTVAFGIETQGAGAIAYNDNCAFDGEMRADAGGTMNNFACGGTRTTSGGGVHIDTWLPPLAAN
jgi:hypothetical protein